MITTVRKAPNIIRHDAAILPRHANPARIGFSERTPAIRRFVYGVGARRISQREERCDAVPLTGSNVVVPISRLKLAPLGPNGS